MLLHLSEVELPSSPAVVSKIRQRDRTLTSEGRTRLSRARRIGSEEKGGKDKCTRDFSRALAPLDAPRAAALITRSDSYLPPLGRIPTQRLEWVAAHRKGADTYESILPLIGSTLDD
jgi:hypothetical protein